MAGQMLYLRVPRDLMEALEVASQTEHRKRPDQVRMYLYERLRRDGYLPAAEEWADRGQMTSEEASA